MSYEIYKRKKHRCFTCEHKGRLMEALETEKPIQFKTFRKLINSGLYEFYTYDERIEANRYIIQNMDKNIGLPTWLHEYKKTTN